MFFHQKKWGGDLGGITGLMVLFRAVLSNQTFCNDGNVLYLSSIQYNSCKPPTVVTEHLKCGYCD